MLPVDTRTGRQEAWPHLADDENGNEIHRHGENAGDNAGDEQLADILLGDDAVDRKHNGWRQHGAERAAGGDHAGGEALRIAEAAHFRIGHGGKCRRRGNR